MQGSNQQYGQDQSLSNQASDQNQHNYIPFQFAGQGQFSGQQQQYIAQPQHLQYSQSYQQQNGQQFQNGTPNPQAQPQMISNQNQMSNIQTQQFNIPQMMAIPGQFPSPFPFPIHNQPLAIQNNNNDKIKQLQNKIKEKEQEIDKLNDDLYDLTRVKNNEIKKLENKILNLNNQIDELSREEQNKDREILKLRNELDQALQKLKNLEQDFKTQKDDLTNKIDEIQGLSFSYKKLEKQLQILTQQDDQKKLQQLLDQQQGQSEEEKKRYKQLNDQKKNIEEQMSQKDQTIRELQAKIKELEYLNSKEHQYFLDSQAEVANWKKKQIMFDKQLQEKDQSIDNITTQLREQKQKNNDLHDKLKGEEENINLLKQQLKDMEALFNQYQQNASNNKSNDQNKKQFEQQLKKLKDEAEYNIIKNNEEVEKNRKLKELQMEESKKKKAMMDQKRMEDKKNENRMIKEIMMKKQQGSLEEYGKLDICYVIDCTKSMEPYVEQARSCVQESLKVIKQQTNRDTIISSVAYYDIEQRPAKGYYQFEFSNNIQAFQKFILEVPIEGGRDIPEDVRGALEQMITKLKWKNKFKIAILITDSPCHGRKYHQFPGDFHPNDDITEVLHRLIEQQIILIGFNLNDKTIKMYDEFKKIYEAKNASDFFVYVDVAGLKVAQLAEKMAGSLGSASVAATQVKSSGTKSKKPSQDRPKNKDGAIEALCKQGDFQNFEKQTKVVDTVFTVLNVKINDQVFADNLSTINNIGKNPQKDYIIKVEGQWNCIRTEFPFAFGMMKDVFLMKKKNGGSDELYVIKTPLGSKPYPSQLEAVQECRSHLICQQLMKKFQTDIVEALEQQNIQRNYPKVVYSDFLILEESKDKYWIAERFFKGEFVKYNNNYGFINEDTSELNKFAQAFSYYTFFVSRGLYMINDVQGVGIYFTDPAVNTATGDFDDTDLGQEGQDMFLVNFQSKQDLASEILNLLNLLKQN
ncbi:unnamed protein product (macronuclear) [Paramecium tetraurelia]|uniref:Alpha-type protein kinase domain-containing protein n=1 Tax=Paramecium tetraurelia TaxID=5888 RepID=A0EB56_PARTE|nr:uncharacterized protein GSPATT00025257001 [Paramecium tetraurelia]CAK92523.1 unnamed protein product [Paramecium tetraurelia]|eukprot:XP_001459920.1 hypothetical protein (macronuclear) [Paramecium tetraurelia strain d4-2]